MPVSSSLPESHSTLNTQTTETFTSTDFTDMDRESQHAFYDTKPMDIDTDYISHAVPA